MKKTNSKAKQENVHKATRKRRDEKRRKGKERKGKERKGKERKGKERKGKERKGKRREKKRRNGKTRQDKTRFMTWLQEKPCYFAGFIYGLEHHLLRRAEAHGRESTYSLLLTFWKEKKKIANR